MSRLMVYQWKPGSRITLDAQVAGEELERIRARTNGLLTAPVVVDAARHPTSPLHNAFEWADDVAAERYREVQARELIRALVVAVKPADAERSIRAFVCVERDDATGYTSLRSAMSDAELRRQVVQRAWRELAQWRERYEGYAELAEVFAVVDRGTKAAEGKALGSSR